MKENIGVSGTWLFVWRDKDGNILETREEHNLITQSGLKHLPLTGAVIFMPGVGAIGAGTMV